jgi:hypothetical protein
MSLEKSERYTCIGIDEDSKQAQIITFIRADLNKLEKLCKQYPKSYQHVSDQYDDDEIVGKEFVCDKRLVSFRAPKNVKEKTEEEKKIICERLQQGKKARKPREKKPTI